MKISMDFGIVVKKSSLLARAVDLKPLFDEFNFTSLFDESDELLSIGPFFGGDMADEFMRRLESKGLIYIDDFFIFSGDFPSWCKFECAINK